jgi:hypothetical protein
MKEGAGHSEVGIQIVESLYDSRGHIFSSVRPFYE